jgi:CheY-like chemotaxis protein
MAGARILVVDDEPAIRLLCRVNLQADGFAVQEAPDGAAAMEIARAWHPELIRDDPSLAGTRVMFLTARADIGDNDRARGTGAVGHVTKPFNPSSLGDEVRAALAR